MLWDAVSRLDCAGRQVGLWRGRTVKYAANQGGLAQRLSKMAGALQRLPEELEKTIKSSSRDLAQGAVELVLASYQARDPNFSPWMALDEFPPGTEDSARAGPGCRRPYRRQLRGLDPSARVRPQLRRGGQCRWCR
uniref:Erythrocyte binding protein-like n=1 Tax=Oryza sativa subsp. japonica TaxID=39947 RepID=Q5VMT7_ORYSJ|nr:erythrocyte binding protein-like [Oryza sativa Japonica Group]